MKQKQSLEAIWMNLQIQKKLKGCEIDRLNQEIAN
jgi:hypothetical protein